MIVLSKETREPIWIQDRHFPGVRIQIRRLNSMQMGAAKARTYDVLAKLRDGEAALVPYGLAGSDASGARFNPADMQEAWRLGLMIGGVETAIEGVIAWEGICIDDAGTLAEINREVLAQLMLDDRFYNWLTAELDMAARILVTEGKPSGPSPTGSSRPEATDLGPTTAPDAGKPTNPAAAASPSTAATAPRSKTGRAPKKG